MKTGKSDSPNVCGLCGGKAYQPQRFADEGDMDGMFNVCGDCGAECNGTGAWDEKERWHWLDARSVEQGRAAMEAAEMDAAYAEEMRYGDW